MVIREDTAASAPGSWRRKEVGRVEMVEVR